MFNEISESYLPRFCLHETIMPSLYLSDHLKIYPNEIVWKEFFSNTGRPIVFSQSTFRLEIDIGTNGSIKFLQSLLKCSDETIFRSSIVQEYLSFKWAKVKPIVYALGFVYIIYLILLGFYIVLFIDSKAFLGVIIFVHIILCLYEVFQIATDFTEYMCNAWNILDQLRSISFSYYALMAVGGRYNNDVLLAVLIFSWSKGIACFRMFDKTRYMVRLIIQVIIDITTFFFILFYATLAFAFVFYIRNPSKSFPIYLTVAYRLDLGDFETNIKETFDWFLFFVSTMINPLIMLNLLIAIMSDTATAVAEIDDICGLKELAEMIIDIEKILFWKKLLVRRHYLHKCAFVEAEDSETDKIMEKLKVIKKQVTFMKDAVKEIQNSSEKIVSTHIENNLKEILEEQEYLKNEMKNGFEANSRIISDIDENINIIFSEKQK